MDGERLIESYLHFWLLIDCEEETVTLFRSVLTEEPTKIQRLLSPTAIQVILEFSGSPNKQTKN